MSSDNLSKQKNNNEYHSSLLSLIPVPARIFGACIAAISTTYFVHQLIGIGKSMRNTQYASQGVRVLDSLNLNKASLTAGTTLNNKNIKVYVNG